MSKPAHILAGRMIEVVHVRTGERKLLEFVASDKDGNARLYWPFGPGCGLAFDIVTGGGLHEVKDWMITDEGLRICGVYPRHAYPKAYLDYREIVAAGRGEVPLPVEKPRRPRTKPHPKQIPMFDPVKK
jgi:hypothetical protein